jgi:drug/metabolite transporter (DMT)-like permease
MRSWLLLFGCNLMWALQFTCVKLVQDQVGPLFTVWGPMTLATIMLYPLIRLEGRAKSSGPGAARGAAAGREAGRQKRDVLVFLLLALIGVFPGQVFITWGTRASLASNAALLMLTLPISTAALAVILLGEKMTPVRWLSFGMAVIGVLLCSGLDFRTLDFGKSYLLGNVLILLGTLGSAFYNSYGKKVLERYSPMQMLYYTYLAMFVVMTPLVLFKEWGTMAQVPNFSGRTWIGLALLTFFHNYLSMVLFLKALKELEAIQAALSNYLITFFGLPIAAIWLGERLKPAAIVGGIVVLASTLLVTVWDSRRPAPVEEGID